MNWLTTFLTVISGSLVFVLGQLFIEFVLKPMRKYKELRAKVAYSLYFYANRYTNGLMDDKDRQSFRELAAEFESYFIEKPKWFFWIKEEAIAVVVKSLTGISNSSADNGSETIRRWVETLKRALNLRAE